jgi:hypothetical protein
MDVPTCLVAVLEQQEMSDTQRSECQRLIEAFRAQQKTKVWWPGRTRLYPGLKLDEPDKTHD